MTDDQLLTLYAQGNSTSHLAGLRAVFDAGRQPVEDGFVVLTEATVGVPDAEPIAEKVGDSRAGYDAKGKHKPQAKGHK